MPLNNTPEHRAITGRLLKNAYLEIMPAPGIEERLSVIPPKSYISITCSPVKGVDQTLDLMERLAGQGWHLVPHVAARMVRDRGHLEEIMARLDASGIHSVFIPGGDAAEPAGIYDCSLDLLRDMAEIGHGFEDIGVASHPEGHALVSDEDLLRLLLEKQKVATYLVTQMCFDTARIVSWLKGIRRAGVRLPAWIGLPGVADRMKLFKISLRIGVGRSAKMLMNQKGLLKNMMTVKPYRPDDLVHGLAPHLTDTTLDIPGFHLFSFNDVERTERWRQEMLIAMGIDFNGIDQRTGQVGGESHA
jgi:methylenetetrahydrofolate reductase (NADPH)